MTARDIFYERIGKKHDPLSVEVIPSDVIDCMQEYARSVAQQVRQQCAEEANLKLITSSGSIEVDKESILSVNVEQFIK